MYICIMAQMNKKTDRKTGAKDCAESLQKLLLPPFFRALGDPTRIALLLHLARQGGPRTVGQTSCCCPVDLSVVSRHLATLREAGILRAEKDGREVYYSVRYPELTRSLRALADAIEACCPPGAECDCDEEAPGRKKDR